MSSLSSPNNDSCDKAWSQKTFSFVSSQYDVMYFLSLMTKKKTSSGNHYINTLLNIYFHLATMTENVIAWMYATRLRVF